MTDRFLIAGLAGVGLVALLIWLPWLTRRRWVTTRPSMWERLPVIPDEAENAEQYLHWSSKYR